ncbi:MAG: transcriptional regulator [Segetibacter sp.]|nr:transcriptional regulator [Segetibacter sp.]
MQEEGCSYPQYPNMTILIAEDDTLILRTLDLYLKRNGYDVLGCVDGHDAMKKIALHNPDLIIANVMLPYFSGLKMIGKLKLSGNTTPIIVISAIGQQSVVEEAMQLGANDYILKPFNLEELRARIEHFAKLISI